MHRFNKNLPYFLPGYNWYINCAFAAVLEAHIGDSVCFTSKFMSTKPSQENGPGTRPIAALKGTRESWEIWGALGRQEVTQIYRFYRWKLMERAWFCTVQETEAFENPTWVSLWRLSTKQIQEGLYGELTLCANNQAKSKKTTLVCDEEQSFFEIIRVWRKGGDCE